MIKALSKSMCASVKYFIMYEVSLLKLHEKLSDSTVS